MKSDRGGTGLYHRNSMASWMQGSGFRPTILAGFRPVCGLSANKKLTIRSDDFWMTRHSPMTGGHQKLRKRKSLALPRTLSRIAGSGSRLEISIAPTIVEKIAKKARSLSLVRRPGINGTIRLL